MSLDITLVGDEYVEDCVCSTCFHEHQYVTREEFYSANITHNLSKMARECGVYSAVWRGEGVERASDLVPVISDGLKLLKAFPGKYKEYDSPNGWGTYGDFVPWLEWLLSACLRYPDAYVDHHR